MAYTTVPTIVTGDVATASWGNTYIKNNFAATAVGVVTTAGDTVYGTAANVIARLGIGTSGYVWRSTGSAPEWANPEDGAKLDGDHLDIDFTPSNYTPNDAPAEAADVDDLAAHLAGIDDAIGATFVVEATQANMEAETGGLLYVPPDLMKYSPGVAKAYCTVIANGTLQSNSYNITSAAKDSTGNYTVTFATDFANANYACVITVEPLSAVTSVATITAVAVGSVSLHISDDGSTAEDNNFHLVAFGDQ